MGEENKHQWAGYWIGLDILERLSDGGTGLTSAEVAAILGVRSVKGIGQALSRTRHSLSQAGIRFDEAVRRRIVSGRTEWSPGPRIRQARHVLEHTCRVWTGGQGLGGVPVEDVGLGYRGPVLVLRALISSGTVYRIDGGMAELDAILDDEWFEIDEGKLWSMGEVFIDRIEGGRDGSSQPVPEGYGENGIWVRGVHDHADPHVAGAIGTGRYPSMLAWIGDAKWIERRIALADAVQQVEKVRAGRTFWDDERPEGWRKVHGEKRFRYVRWVATARNDNGPYHAPPLRMRLRCWYELVISNAKGQRIVLREEGLRGDAGRTSARAIDRWRKTQAEHRDELVAVGEFRIAKRQPRPMPPE